MENLIKLLGGNPHKNAISKIHNITKKLTPSAETTAKVISGAKEGIATITFESMLQLLLIMGVTSMLYLGLDKIGSTDQIKDATNAINSHYTDDPLDENKIKLLFYIKHKYFHTNLFIKFIVMLIVAALMGIVKNSTSRNVYNVILFVSTISVLWGVGLIPAVYDYIKKN